MDQFRKKGAFIMPTILKKYVIHILSVKVLSSDSFDLPKEEYALIVLSEDEQNPAFDLCEKSQFLRLSFEDVGESNPNACSSSDAEKAFAFLNTLPDTVTDLYICCDYGESRSPAVAAAVLLASGRNDQAVWGNPYYHPNAFVFRIFCQAFGVAMSDADISDRIRKNEQAFQNAIRHISENEYEKWQLLF